MKTPKRWKPEQITERDQIVALMRDAGRPLSAREIGRGFVRFHQERCDGTRECFTSVSGAAAGWSEYLHAAAGLDVRWARGQIAHHVHPVLKAMVTAGWVERVTEDGEWCGTWRLASDDLLSLEDMGPLNVMEAGR